MPRLLIVDSDAIFLLMVLLHFRRRGWTVITASGGYEALERLEPTLDAVILDINMQGISPEEFLRHARERRDLRKVCFIVLTEDHWVPRLVECLRLGASDYVERSILPQRLEHVLIERVSRVQRLAKQPGDTIRAFLAYARTDSLIVRNLSERLRRDHIALSLDLARARIAGPEWDLEILRALRRCDVVLVCPSSNSVSHGSLQTELQIVLDLADDQSWDAILVILVKLNTCEVPQRLRRRHTIDLTVPEGYAKLLAALHGRFGDAATFPTSEVGLSS